jgi:hypothetical protein
MSGRRGFKFTGNKVKVEKAPEFLLTTETDMKPGPLTTVVRSLLARPEPVARPAAVKKLAVPKPKPAVNPPIIARSTVVPSIFSGKAPAPVVAEAPGPKKFTIKKPLDKFEDPDLEEMAILIREEEKKNPYENPAGPDSYVPETRRGFSQFIKMNYDKFMLQPTESTTPTEAGD